MRSARLNSGGRGRRRRHGFVLLLVLTLIAVSGLYAAGTAKTSIAIVLESAARQDSLQKRWARESLKTVALGNAPQILMPPGRSTEVRTSLSHVVTLRGTTYRVIIADEDAKLPVNTVRRLLDEETTARLVEATCPGTRLREHDDRQAPFGAWEEALKYDQGIPGPQWLAVATDNMTLWGSGRINVDRARPEFFAAVMTEVFGSPTADRMLEIIGRGRVRSAQDLAAQLALNLEQRQRLEMLVGTSSDAYSLWILPAGLGKAELHVVERFADRQGTIVSYLW